MRERTAVLIIDVQRGAFDGERCPVITGSEPLLANIARLIDAARSSNLEAVFIQHSAPKGAVLEEGSSRWQFHPDIRPLEGEAIVTKRESSAFNGTPLHDVLQALDIGSLILCGLQSEHCVAHTARSGLGLGYTVTLARDAHSTWPDGGWTAEQLVARENERLARQGTVLKSTEDLIRELEAQAPAYSNSIPVRRDLCDDRLPSCNTHPSKDGLNQTRVP